MRLKKLRLAVLTSLILSLGAAGASPVAAGAAVTKVPLVLSNSAQTDILGCVGERVTVTDGNFQVVSAQTPTRWLFHRNVVSGDAIGNVTGAPYKITGHIQEIVIAPPTSAFVYTFELTLNVTSLGSGVGFAAHALEHVTITPQGDLTSYIEVFDVTCR